MTINQCEQKDKENIDSVNKQLAKKIELWIKDTNDQKFIVSWQKAITFKNYSKNLTRG